MRHLPRLEIVPEDVHHAPGIAGEEDGLAIRGEGGRFLHVHARDGDFLEQLPLQGIVDE